MSATLVSNAAPMHADEHDARELRRLVLTGLAVIAALLLALAAWLALAPLAGAVVAAGVVKVDTERKIVQHQDGGTVARILVRNGDTVQAGQTLVLLHDVQLDASLELLRLQIDAEELRQSRLQAERLLLATFEPPPRLRARQAEPRLAELLKRERDFFRLRRLALDAQGALLHTQVGATQQEITARSAQAAAETDALALQQQELQANEPLVAQGFIAQTRLLALQRGMADSQARRGTNQAELAQARQRVADTTLRGLNLRNDYVQQAERDLKDSTVKLFDLQERLRPSQDAVDRQRITAPVAGVVVDLKLSTEGAVVGARERLMDIVPSNPTLVVEARVRPEDITHARIGAAAEVRLTAFQQRSTPALAATLVYLSADRLNDATPGTAPHAGYYTAQLRIDAAALARLVPLQLQAGMPAEVYLTTAARTPLAYWLDPVLGTLRRGMREP